MEALASDAQIPWHALKIRTLVNALFDGASYFSDTLNGSDSLLRACSTWSAMDKLLEVVNIARSSFCIVCGGNNCEAITNDAH